MDIKELRILQGLPLELKIAKSKARIREYINHMGSDSVYISFSGGKDSTVLLDLVRKVYNDIPAVFSNTGLEFPEITKFALSKENIIQVRPKKTFKQVIETEGYPIISKKTSRMIHDLQNPTEKNERSRQLYLSDFTIDKNGNATEKKNGSFKLAKKHRYLINAPFKISNRCCDILKKEPLHRYERESGRRAIIGTMAAESSMREASYLKQGCNVFTEGKEKCQPMSFWTEQDVLQYILKYNLEYASVYGEIIEQDGKLITTGEKRTGYIV